MLYGFEEFILEEYLKLDAPLYYSKAFKDTLYALTNKGDKVAKVLYYAEQSDEYKTDMTFVDLGTGNDKVSFIQVNRVLRMLDKEAGDPESKNQGKLIGQLPEDYLNKMYRLKNSQTNAVWNQQRTELGIGRFVTKVLQKTTDALIKIDQNDINAFVDKFKAYRDFQSTKKDKFEVVQGEDIRKWYDEDTYEDAQYHLNNSCMRYGKCQKYLNIYTENTNQVSMVIMKGSVPDKIIGRALIWKLDNGETYLDRPYANSDEDVNLFKEWGKSKGYVVYGDSYSHKEVTLDKSNFQYYPYMDTFRRFDPNEGILYNDDDEDESYEGQYILNDTGGGYEEIASGVWSEWHDRRIPHDEAVWSDWADSYLYRDRAIYIETGSRRYRDSWYPEDCDDIVYDEWIDEPIHTDDAVYSDAYGYHLYDENAVEVIKKIDSDGEAIGAD